MSSEDIKPLIASLERHVTALDGKLDRVIQLLADKRDTESPPVDLNPPGVFVVDRAVKSRVVGPKPPKVRRSMSRL